MNPLADEVFLRHMVDAIEPIMEFTAAHSPEAFAREWVLQNALLHELQILGEAAGRLSRDLTDRHPEVPWADVTGLRHKVVHDYFVVDFQVVWDTATLDVPVVRPQIEGMLREITGPS